MGVLRRRARQLLERLTGYDIIRGVGGSSVALIDQKRRKGAWFLHDMQLKLIFDEFKIDLVVDVGANEGQFAQRLRLFYAGEIHSFEPVASAYERLAGVASSDRNWHVHKFALGSQECTKTLNVSDQTVFSSFLKTNEYCTKRFGRGAIGTQAEMVSVRRLDRVLDDIAPGIESKRTFIKMDTQGYDLEVFKGLGTRLESVVAFQSEVSLVPIYEGMPHWTESISTYEQSGFGVVGMYPVTRDSWRIIECDCLLMSAAFHSGPASPPGSSQHNPAATWRA
jgi:FkbM family methyltransferase